MEDKEVVELYEKLLSKYQYDKNGKLVISADDVDSVLMQYVELEDWRPKKPWYKRLFKC